MPGQIKSSRKWPSPYTVASGLLLAIALFKYIYYPLQWVALGAVAVGLPPIIHKAVIGLRGFVLNINMLMLISGKGLQSPTLRSWVMMVSLEYCSVEFKVLICVKQLWAPSDWETMWKLDPLFFSSLLQSG